MTISSGSEFKDIFQFNRECLGIQPKKSEARDLSAGEVAFLRKALAEESDELLLASVGVDPGPLVVLSDRNRQVAMVDSLIDAAYFAIGGLARMGLTEDQARSCFDAVHAANMEKKLGVSHRGNMGVVDAAKPTGWVSPEQRIKVILFGG